VKRVLKNVVLRFPAEDREIECEDGSSLAMPSLDEVEVVLDHVEPGKPMSYFTDGGTILADDSGTFTFREHPDLDPQED
jgi:hypothetical protein